MVLKSNTPKGGTSLLLYNTTIFTIFIEAGVFIVTFIVSDKYYTQEIFSLTTYDSMY